MGIRRCCILKGGGRASWGPLRRGVTGWAPPHRPAAPHRSTSCSPDTGGERLPAEGRASEQPARSGLSLPRSSARPLMVCISHLEHLALSLCRGTGCLLGRQGWHEAPAHSEGAVRIREGDLQGGGGRWVWKPPEARTWQGPGGSSEPSPASGAKLASLRVQAALAVWRVAQNKGRNERSPCRWAAGRGGMTVPPCRAWCPGNPLPLHVPQAPRVARPSSFTSAHRAREQGPARPPARPPARQGSGNSTDGAGCGGSGGVPTGCSLPGRRQGGEAEDDPGPGPVDSAGEGAVPLPRPVVGSGPSADAWGTAVNNTQPLPGMLSQCKVTGTSVAFAGAEGSMVSSA